MLDWGMSLGSVLVGFIVGLTGMGGGALMTPMLVLFFGVPPLTAVGSDLVASALMKPVGGGVHLKRGSVHRGLATWLVLGSVPAAFIGVYAFRQFAEGSGLQSLVRTALGFALLLVGTALVAKNLIKKRQAVVEDDDDPATLHQMPVRRGPTLVVGALGGLVVGATSVGSGSLMMLALLLLYPGMRLSRLVGTDLVQAVPLVVAAALAHIWAGSVEWSVTFSVALGAIPGIFLGARLSSRAPDHLIRPVLVVVLWVSGAKLLGAPTWLVFSTAALGLGGALAFWFKSRGKAPSLPGRTPDTA